MTCALNLLETWHANGIMGLATQLVDLSGGWYFCEKWWGGGAYRLLFFYNNGHVSAHRDILRALWQQNLGQEAFVLCLPLHGGLNAQHREALRKELELSIVHGIKAASMSNAWNDSLASTFNDQRCSIFHEGLQALLFTLSVSTSQSTSPAAISSPSFFFQAAMLPCKMKASEISPA